jgi:glutamyl-tRNA synthetase
LAKDTPSVEVDLVEYDHLIKVKTIEEDQAFEDYYNQNSKFVT